MSIQAEERLATRWTTYRFFPSLIERLLVRYWPIALFLIFSPLLVVPWFSTGSTMDHLKFTRNLLGVGFVSSLLVTCVLAGAAVALWERTFRNTFGNALENGLIKQDDPACIREYEQLSDQIEPLMGSRWRYSIWFLIVLFMVLVNRGPLSDLVKYLRHIDPIDDDFFEDTAILLTQFFLAYVAGMVSWSLIAGALWTSKLSKSSCLQIQPGHSDNSCGLANVGLCSLQNALPLLLGMLLLFLWGYGDHLPWFANHVNLDFLSFIRNYVFALLVVLFALACALVFLPVMSLHKRLRAYKSEQDKEYSAFVREQCELSKAALSLNEEVRTKFLADRLKLVQSFDPVILRLSTWPFDRASLFTYGLAPVLTLLAPIVKDLLLSPFMRDLMRSAATTPK